MDLHDYLENSGTDGHVPFTDRKSLPRRYVPFFIRWPLKLLIYPFVILDQFAQKIARLIIPPPFVKAGKCKKRGNCCQYILIRKFKGTLGFLDLFWHTQINGFFRRRKDPILHENKQVYVMGCRYLKKNGKCGNYFFRPQVCRSWPRIEIFGQPEILKGCGFYAKERTKHPLNILTD